MNDPQQPAEDTWPLSGWAPVVLGMPETSGLGDAYRWSPTKQDA
jgi:hypothetical protein